MAEVGHNLAGVALDESGTALAAWGEDRLSLLAVDASIAPRSAELGSQRVRRVRLADSVVAVLADGDGLRLRTWSRPNLDPGGPGLRWSEVETDGLLTRGDRAVLWGRQGADLDFSAGSPWLRLCELSDPVAEAWHGDGLDAALNGVVYPLRNGHLGVYSADTLVELAERDGGWHECGRRPWDGFASCVSSADGNHILALGSEGDEDDARTYLRVVRLDDDKALTSGSLEEITVGYATTAEIGEPTALAVGNDARATVAYVSADLVLHILTLTGDDLAARSVQLG